MSIKGLLRFVVLTLLFVAIQGTWVLAGTTGSIQGIVTDDNGRPIAGASVTALAPSQITLHMQLTYEATTRLTLVGNIVNLYNRCYGGNGPAFLNVTADRSKACGVTLPGYGGVTSYVGNFYNPGDSIQQWVKYPYEPSFTYQPVEYGIEAKFSL